MREWCCGRVRLAEASRVPQGTKTSSTLVHCTHSPYGVSGFGFRASSFGFRVSGFGPRVTILDRTAMVMVVGGRSYGGG